MSLLILDRLKKHYGAQEVLSGAELRIDPGEKIGLVGRNGGGKTTLLRLIEGVETPDWGSVRLRKGAESQGAGLFKAMTNWARMRVNEVFDERHKGLEGRELGDIDDKGDELEELRAALEKKAMPEDAREDMYRSTGASLPIGRVGSTEEIAQAVLFIMTNGYLTGQVLDIDGGHMIRQYAQR